MINHISIIFVRLFHGFFTRLSAFWSLNPSPSDHPPQEWVMAFATVVMVRMTGNTPRSVGIFVQSRGEQERHLQLPLGGTRPGKQPRN